MSMFRQLMMANALPYKKLQYLESTAVQYIDSKVKSEATDDSIKIECAVKWKADRLTRGEFMGFSFGNWDFFGHYVDGKYYQIPSVAASTDSFDIIGLYQYDGRTKCKMFANDTYSDELELTIKRSITVQFFKTNNGNAYWCSCYMKYAKVWVNDVLKFDASPVLWKANKPYVDGYTGSTVTPAADKPGMIDAITGKLFVNRGTGDDFNYA